MVPLDGEVDIFALQEQVIASILQSSVEQVAVEEAPKLLDPIQQTVATTLRGYLASAQVNRKELIAIIQRVVEPQPGVYIKALRKAYESFQSTKQLATLLDAVKQIGTETASPPAESDAIRHPIEREDLRLVCFEYVWL